MYFRRLVTAATSTVTAALPRIIAIFVFRRWALPWFAARGLLGDGLDGFDRKSTKVLVRHIVLPFMMQH